MTRENAGLFDETSFNKIEVRGPGALAFLNYVCANDIDQPVGSVVYTQCLNKRGGIECDFTVTRLAEERFFIITGTAFGQHDMSWLSLNMPEDGSVAHRGCRFVLRLHRVVGTEGAQDFGESDQRGYLERRLPVHDRPEDHRRRYPGIWRSRVTYVGELGWEFYCPMEYGLRLWDTLWEAGEPEGMVAGGYKAIDTLRLEKAYRYWSAEISPDYTPYEAGLGFAVKLDKGDFLGREALLKQKARRPEAQAVLPDASR